jgi:hypothetical protein
MAELVDASDSKSDSARSAGSIPARGTKTEHIIGLNQRAADGCHSPTLGGVAWVATQLGGAKRAAGGKIICPSRQPPKSMSCQRRQPRGALAKGRAEFAQHLRWPDWAIIEAGTERFRREEATGSRSKPTIRHRATQHRSRLHRQTCQKASGGRPRRDASFANSVRFVGYLLISTEN